MKKHYWMVLLAALACGAIGLTMANAQGGGGGPAVAVVHLDRLYQSLDELTDYQASEGERRQQLDAELKARQQEVDDLKSDLDLMTPGTQGYRDAQDELQKKVVDARVWAEVEKAKLNRDAGIRVEDVYRRALDAVSQVAQERGFDLVLYAESEPAFRYENNQQLSTLISMRKVLYANPALDITDEVAQRMNQ